MAKIEGTQSVPSELIDAYRGNLTDAMPNNVVRSRYPYRLPLKQDGGYKVTANQKTQRLRWLTIKDKFKQLPWASRQRWYAARPPWNSLLWYYNYFIMSGLLGNAVVADKGGGVIKDINHYTFALTAGTAPLATIAIDTCDPAKAVAFFYGAGYYEVDVNVVVANYPYLKSLNSSQMIVGMSIPLNHDANLSVSLIEYI